MGANCKVKTHSRKGKKVKAHTRKKDKKGSGKKDGGSEYANMKEAKKSLDDQGHRKNPTMHNY